MHPLIALALPTLLDHARQHTPLFKVLVNEDGSGADIVTRHRHHWLVASASVHDGQLTVELNTPFVS